MTLLAESAIFLGAAVLAVPLFRRLKLGAVLGYLAAGVVIGPSVLKLVTDVENILSFAELGVVLLLFLIGLELQPSRLWVLRRSVFGLGTAQVLGTAVILGGIALVLGSSWQASVVIGFGLAMSSTAFVLQVLAERRELTTRYGRSAFAILLFQDLSVIPLLALIPLLASGPDLAQAQNPWVAAAKAIGVIFAVVFGGRILLRKVLDVIAHTALEEIFTAAALLLVVGIALLMTAVGLSMSLGAFLAGVLLADSEYRHELEAAIEPFKGLLLGLFFISVGMSADLSLIVHEPLSIIGAVVVLIAVKAAIVFAIATMAGHSRESARNLAAALAQGGEFAFVLFTLAGNHKIMNTNLVDRLIVIVTLSMAATPFVLKFNDALRSRLVRVRQDEQYDVIDEAPVPVIIAGFGRVGQIVGRLLNLKKIPFTALDRNAEQVETVRRFGRKVYYGDASRLDLLRSAKVDKAKIFVLAIDDVEVSLRTAETVRRHFPEVKIFARARNRFHAYRLMDLNCELIERETLRSSLHLAQQLLIDLEVPAWDAANIVARFQLHDEQSLQRQHAVYHDETQLIQSAREAASELEDLLQQDREEAADIDSSSVPFSPSDVR